MISQRILLIGDDPKIALLVLKRLRGASFAVDQVADNEVGFPMASTEPYYAAIIDIVVNKSDGVSLIEKLRGQEIYTPVLILGAKRAIDGEVKDKQKGDYDYLSRPFSTCQILAHVEMLIHDGPRSTESPLSNT